jgi:hypothetical protein
VTTIEAAPPPRPPRTRAPVRAANSGIVDVFLVIAVATVLIIRVYLEVTNYPQLGGNGLHIAHVLWGGLGMVIAIGLLLAFLSGSIKLVAAVAGGVGFGAFIDELGKFVTSDNNYFFRPTAAIVYVVFVVLFLAVRQLRRLRRLTPAENLVNAIEISKDLATGNLTVRGQHQALALLDAADPENPLGADLRNRFLEYAPAAQPPSRLARTAAATRRWYVARAGKRWFRRVVATLFILRAISAAATFLGLIVLVPLAITGDSEAIAEVDAIGGPTGWIAVGASLVAGALTISGLLAYRGSRLKAYRRFEYAVLVNLLLAQPFTLLDAGFAGAADVIFDLLLLVSLGYMQAQERAGLDQLHSEYTRHTAPAPQVNS